MLAQRVALNYFSAMSLNDGYQTKKQQERAELERLCAVLRELGLRL